LERDHPFYYPGNLADKISERADRDNISKKVNISMIMILQHLFRILNAVSFEIEDFL
jgi:hypothetical protein